MVISCIARMKRGYGSTMIIDVLRGSKNKKVLELGFDSLSTYGLMKKYSNEDLKTFINTLVSHGFLDIVENIGMRGSYPTIRLNEQSLNVIKKEIKVEFKEAKVTKSRYVENELYEKLINIRSEIAKTEGVAPYMVFGDATLRNMASLYATTKDEMMNISGVGEIKYQKYGKLFENEIKLYLVEKNIDKDSLLNKYDEAKTNTIKDSEYFEVKTDKNLHEKLKEFRLNVSKVEGTLPYMILSGNTLKEISGRYPLDEEQLKDISGIGPVKINKYGEDIIDIVKVYVYENNIVPKWEDKKRLKLILDGDNRKNDEIVLDLLNQGQNIKDVCEEIEVSVSTALGYIYDYIKQGQNINFDIDIKSMYKENEKEMILDAIDRFGDEKISYIKKALPDFVKYESIRAIILEKYIDNL
jgi:ATP-dependent DNA helicase RecQ